MLDRSDFLHSFSVMFREDSLALLTFEIHLNYAPEEHYCFQVFTFRRYIICIIRQKD